MTKEEIILAAVYAAAGAGALAVLGEWLHARRVKRLARLAFGPNARPRVWTVMASPLRVLTLAAVVWSLIVLIAFEGSSRHH